MPIIRFLIISILFVNALKDPPGEKTLFISPVRIPLALSSNFGELRLDHYHSGLDIKTQGSSGKEVVASAEGYVYRINVSPGGFGKALYIRHSSGYTTVYGHLDRFAPTIEKWVNEKQYENKSFLVTLYPQKEMFHVRQGELIAYSGNSGSSSGPHLHYEIRKSDSEIPVNPLQFDFGIPDNKKPVIEKLVVYPANSHTRINKQNTSKKISVSGSNGSYSLPAGTTLTISGEAGFGIKSYDLLDGGSNKCGIYSINLSVDSKTVFRYVMDSFPFSESRYINSHIDYETLMRDKIFVERTFVLPNDRSGLYSELTNKGLIDFTDDKIHSAVITVTDINNNKATLSFRIKSEPPAESPSRDDNDNDLKIMPYNRTNKFASEDMYLNIPSGALYDTLRFSYRKSPGTWDMLSGIHSVHNRFTPVHKAFTLGIRPSRIPAGKESKMLIARLDEDNQKQPQYSTWSDGYLVTEAMTFGRYFVGIDSVAPLIAASSLTPGVNLTGRTELRIRITDDFSGIKSYEPAIDGNWALFEYDQKNNLLIYKFDKSRITIGTKHSLTLKVSDNRDNVSYFSCDFKW